MMSLLYILVLLLVYSIAIYGWQVNKVNNHCYRSHNHDSNDIIVKHNSINRLKNTISSLIISSSLLLSSSSSSFAIDLPDISSDSDVTTISTSTSTNAIRIISTTSSNIKQDKKVSNTISNDDDDDLSYGASLAKEQKKQESRKKSKSERARDLCESLGRGC